MAGLFDGYEQLPGIFAPPRVALPPPVAPGMQGAVTLPPRPAPAAQPGFGSRLLSGLQTAIGGENDPALSEEENRKARNAALLRAGLSMLANSGPSSQPVGFGRILAGGIAAGQEAGAASRATSQAEEQKQKLAQIIQSGAGPDQLLAMYQQQILDGDTEGARATATVLQSALAAQSKGQGNLQRFQGPDGKLYTFDPTTGEAKPIAGPNGEPMSAPTDLESKDLGDRIVWYPTGHPERIVHIQRKGSVASAQPSLQVVQTADGLATFNPKTGEVAPITNPNGAQIKPKSSANVAIVKSVASNRKQISVIDNAIQHLSEHPSAVGLSRGISDALNQRLDPKGVQARADIADIGSLTFHDRSGAAVSAHEYPRLAPFIPGVKDTPEAVLTKLRRMKKIIEEETDALSSNANAASTPYSPDNPFAP
jgi:hypothetical protein